MSIQTTRRGGAGEQGGEEEQPSLASEVPLIMLRGAWKYRWQLAPLYLGCGAGIGVGSGHALAVAGGLGAAAAVSELAARTEVKAPGDRMLLSVPERRTAAMALAGTGAWAALTSLIGLPAVADIAALSGVLAWPTHLWWASRRPQPPQPPPPSPWSPMAQDVLMKWAGDISIGDGPRALRGSFPIPETIVEPVDGALTTTVQLADGVHAQTAVTTAVRQQIERRLGLPRNTVKLEEVHEDSGHMRVIITKSRHLEVEGGLEWAGPVLLETGDIPLAEIGDGSEVGIPLFRKDGIRHGQITGTTGVGKSVSSVSVIVPGLHTRLEIVLYVDGKRGTSAPYLRPFVKYARRDEQWPIAVELIYRIMVDRQDRRGAAGKFEFHALEEDEPIITLFIDEPGEVGRSRFFKQKHVQMVSAMLEHGRALGIRVIQCGQSAAGEDLIGGVQARGLMSSGWSINHRSGGKGATRLALDSANVEIALNELPAGGAAITVGGKLVGFPAQVRHATPERVLEVMAGVEIRQLEDTDLAAVGAAWDAPHWEDAWTPGYVFPPDFHLTAGVPAGQSPSSSPSSSVQGTVTTTADARPETGQGEAEADEDLPESRMWVLSHLFKHPEGMTLKQLQDLAESEDGAPSRRTISNALKDLMARGQVRKHGGLWIATPPEASDEPVE